MMASTSEIYSAVTSHYSAASAGRTQNGVYESSVAEAFGYTKEELAAIPKNANLGLSCGNPHVLADLRHGETVVDLGSGAGFDVFLAAPKVGAQGLVIGVDMNKDMLEKAKRNQEKSGFKNVRFIEAPITKITPLESASVDCIMSNCVVNLVPEEEKHLVFEEMYRVLKPGGRVAISDILIKDGMDLPANLKNDMALLVGCIAGASRVSGYEKYLMEAGFKDVLVVDNHKDLNVYKTDGTDDGTSRSCCGTTVQKQSEVPMSCGTTAKKACSGKDSAQQIRGGDYNSVDFNTHAGSYNVYAVK